jgi:hypothetical protein
VTKREVSNSFRFSHIVHDGRFLWRHYPIVQNTEKGDKIPVHHLVVVANKMPVKCPLHSSLFFFFFLHIQAAKIIQQKQKLFD